MPSAHLPQSAPPRPMGWADVKALYLHGVGLKELSRVSEYSEEGIRKRALREHWVTERTQLHKEVRAHVLARWGEDATKQGQELTVLQGRLAMLLEQEVTEREQGPLTQAQRKAQRERMVTLQMMSQVAEQIGRSLRLLTGQPTERRESVTLVDLMVAIENRRGNGGGEGEEKDPMPTSSPLPSPFPTLPLPAARTKHLP